MNIKRSVLACLVYALMYACKDGYLIPDVTPYIVSRDPHLKIESYVFALDHVLNRIHRIMINFHGHFPFLLGGVLSTSCFV